VAKFAGVTVTVGQILTVDESLEIGTVSATVEVQASIVPPIELRTPRSATWWTQSECKSFLSSCATRIRWSSSARRNTKQQRPGWLLRERRWRAQQQLLTGWRRQHDTEVPGIPGGLNSLNPDSTQEFRVITNNYAAEYGRNNGAVIEAITKSGGNQIHGTAYEFGRYNAMGARDFFNPRTGPMAAAKSIRPQRFWRIGRRSIKKDKTFWFGIMRANVS